MTSFSFRTNKSGPQGPRLTRAISNTIPVAAPLAAVCSIPGYDDHDAVTGSVSPLGHDSNLTLVDNEKDSSWTPSQTEKDTQTQTANGLAPVTEKTVPHDDLHRTSTSSSSSASTIRDTRRDLENTISRISTDPLGNTYPEGGLQAYLVVFGSFCGCITSLGFMNTLSTYTAYLTTHQLADVPKSTAGWIFGIYAFLSFFLGVQIGPLFDAFGPRWLVASGSVCILLTYILLSFCTQFWHFILVFGVLGGTGTSLVFTPSIAAVGHWFYLRRATFTGVACVGGSLGGIIFPLTLQALFPMENIGWEWSQRILALINLPFVICANLFIRSRLPATRPVRKEAILPDPRIFRDKTFALVTAGVFFVEWGLFVPIDYLTGFALNIGIDRDFSYQLIAIFNAGSCLGRWLPGLIADRIGRFNCMILTSVICWLSAFAFWLPPDLLLQSTETVRLSLLIVFAVIFGFGSGSGISLVPVCVGQLCRTEEYGRYYATCYTVVSFATLTGIPLAGGLVIKDVATGAERFWGAIVFTGLSYLVSTAVFVAAKGTRVGFGSALWSKKF